MNKTPEQKARDNIDRMLERSGWVVVSAHGTLKLENSPTGRDWKFGLHAFVLLMNASILGRIFQLLP